MAMKIGILLIVLCSCKLQRCSHDTLILLIVLCSCKLQRCSHDTLTLIAGGQEDKRADTVYLKDFAVNQFDRLFLNLGETKIVQLRNR